MQGRVGREAVEAHRARKGTIGQGPDSQYTQRGGTRLFQPTAAVWHMVVGSKAFLLDVVRDALHHLFLESNTCCVCVRAHMVA